MSSIGLMRIIDASLNRATEGLRVAEDYLRFVADDAFLTREIKALRHDLAEAAAASVAGSSRHAARDAQGDVGTGISTEQEQYRADAWAVCAASLKRTEQSLRSLEEYGKLVSPEFARRMEALRYRMYTLEKAIDIGRTSRERLEGVRLCVLIDGQSSPDQFERLVTTLVEAGAGMIQLRDKSLNDRTLVERARSLVSLTRHKPPAEPEADYRTLAVVNDRADIAAAVDADGVHLGQEDLSVKDARAIIGPQMLIGRSTHNIEQARRAVLDGANYLGVGPTFPSRTKAFDSFAGLDYLRQAAAEIPLPTFAIGGINAENLNAVLETGMARVAVGNAVSAASDMGVAVRELLSMLNAHRPAPKSEP